MATGHVPWWNDIQGQNYAGKLCILCFFDMVCKLEMRYLFGAGLLVPKSKLPFHILKDMDSASVTMKSSSSDFKRMEFLIALKIQQKVF
jgi:hypothetical protein